MQDGFEMDAGADAGVGAGADAGAGATRIRRAGGRGQSDRQGSTR